MSYLYPFLAITGAAAYGVGVATGMWAQRHKDREEIEHSRDIISDLRTNANLEREGSIKLYHELTATKDSLNAVTISYDETRHKLIETQNELTRALSRLCCTLYDVADIRREKIEELKKLEEEIGTKCTTDVVEKLEAAMKERSE